MSRVLFSMAVAVLALTGAANAQQAVEGIDLSSPSYTYGEDFGPISPVYEPGPDTLDFLFTEGSESVVLTLPIDLQGDWSLVLMEVEVEWPLDHVRRPWAYRSEDFYAVAFVLPLGGDD